MSELFDTFIDTLGIPQVCYLNQKLFKKQFYELAKLNKAQRDQFSKEVSFIVWTYTLKKGSINISPLVTDRLEYIEIAFLHVDLKEKTHFKKVAEVLHRIPYAVVLMMTFENKLSISTALKHINQADTSKLTIDEYFYSEWIDLSTPSEAQKAFLESLQIRKLSFENFYAFYQDICDRIVALQASTMGSGFSTDQTSQKKQILDKIYPLEEQIVSLKNAIKKESQFNAKVRLNMQVKKLTEQIEELKKQMIG